MFGQDESMYFPHSLKNFYWSFQDYIAQRNKTEGIGIVVSLLISREFRWTFGLNDGQLKKVLASVNNNRKYNIYHNPKVAMVALGANEKYH